MRKSIEIIATNKQHAQGGEASKKIIFHGIGGGINFLDFFVEGEDLKILYSSGSDSEPEELGVYVGDF